jgi:16S rRNA (cytosine967-C5)-methyltransferase
LTASRRCAFAVVRRVFERGAYADRAFRVEADRLGLAGRDRAFAMRLAYGVVQRRATLDWVIEQIAGRATEQLDLPVLAALRLGVYQLVYMEGVADHAAVGESVELAKDPRRGGHRLVNAVLRRAAREARPLVAGLGDSTPAEAALRHSHPAWIAELWWEALGPDEARSLLARDNQPAESAARANHLRVTTAEVAGALEREGVRTEADPRLPEALVLLDPFDLHGSALFADGMVMPQSRASMMVARVLGPRAGERVLDLCAAPGAKATHAAALMGDEGQVVAVEADARRARGLAANCERLGASCVEVREGDAAEPRFGSGYDRVLADPPCSDLGTLQSRPDARWRKAPGQVSELAALQRRILDAAAGAVKPGGRLVYSTCTISPEENERQVERFLAEHAEFERFDLSGPYPDLAGDNGFLQTLPHRDGTDGFFVAALDRNGQAQDASGQDERRERREGREGR